MKMFFKNFRARAYSSYYVSTYIEVSNIWDISCYKFLVATKILNEYTYVIKSV